MSAPLQELRGTFRRVAWSAPGEGRRFVIASIDVEVGSDGQIPRLESVSVKGEADPTEFVKGLGYRFWGAPEKANEHGKQFKFRQLKRDEPHSRVAVVGYLTQFATGIGPVYASQLWDAFGADAVRVLRSDPKRAADAIGISQAKAKQASEALNTDGQNEDLRLELVQIFDGRGFPKNLVDTVIKMWGLSAPQRIRRDPFTLLVNKLPGCGFARCDRLYQDLGLPLDLLKRQFACIWKALKDDGDGHTWHPIQVAEAAVKRGINGLAEENMNWKRAVRLGQRAGWLRMRKDSDGKWWIAEAKKADNEASVAADMRRLMGASNANSSDGHSGIYMHDSGSDCNGNRSSDSASNGRASCCDGRVERGDTDLGQQGDDVSLQISEVLRDNQRQCLCDEGAGDIVGERKVEAAWPNPDDIPGLTPHQREQLRLAFRDNVCILTGDPGTGKTTAAAMVLKYLSKSHLVMACSPTNLAAMRLRAVLESHGVTDVTVSTFHRTLGVQRNGHDGSGWGFFYNRRNPLPCKVLLIDEDSMRDIDISASLLESLRTGTLVLFLGDTNQLPPVGHGAPLRDGIAAKIPHGHFTEILRNSGSITEFCRNSREGKRPRPPIVVDIKRHLNWRHYEISSPAKQKSKVSTLLKQLGSYEINGQKIDPIRDTQILVALNEKGDLSRKDLNLIARDALNPFGATVEGNPFRQGDKVICQQNCYLKLWSDDDSEFESDSDGEAEEEFVANGEIGFVTRVEKRFSVVDLTGGRVVRVPVARGDESPNGNFDLAYAITFHKSQGSQWKIVILVSDRAANRLGSRELWNTGGSRPQVLLITIGELATIEKQCQRVALRDRKTFLAETIRDA